LNADDAVSYLYCQHISVKTFLHGRRFGNNRWCLNSGKDFILEKSIDPRKTQKARKYSKRYQVVDRHPKGEWLRNTTY
jgi:hypothetical protein